MSRETSDTPSGSIKENPRHSYKATGENLTLAVRLRHLPMNRMSCGNQPANIRLISDFSPHHREKFPYSFRYHKFGFTLKKQSDFMKLL
jgi:hypothetical protein